MLLVLVMQITKVSKYLDCIKIDASKDKNIYF